MNLQGSFTALSNLEALFCLAAIFAIAARRSSSQYRFLVAFLATRLISDFLAGQLLRPSIFHLSAIAAYNAYFYIYWVSHAIETVLGLGVVIGIFNLAMEPLEGLRELGMVMFKWAGAISVAIALSISFGPHLSSESFVMHLISQLQRTQSVLTLCMLLFVCFAIRPMGLTVRCRIFGVSLGLGLLAATDLVQAAWIQRTPSTVYSLYTFVNNAAITLALLIWIGYFAVPEPRRRMILLPTTSPFFRWNQISEALGDAPGYVAVGRFTSDMFAPAEIEVMRRASTKMTKATTG